MRINDIDKKFDINGDTTLDIDMNVKSGQSKFKYKWKDFGKLKKSLFLWIILQFLDFDVKFDEDANILHMKSKE